MITRLAVKSSLLGSFGSVAYVSTIIDIPDKTDNKSSSAEISETQRKQFQTTNWEAMTLHDVEMFEKRRGCRFAFSDDFGKNKNYTVREWFNEKIKKEPERKEYWRSEFAVAVKYYNHHCKAGSILVIERPNKGSNLGPKLNY